MTKGSCPGLHYGASQCLSGIPTCIAYEAMDKIPHLYPPLPRNHSLTEGRPDRLTSHYEAGCGAEAQRWVNSEEPRLSVEAKNDRSRPTARVSYLVGGVCCLSIQHGSSCQGKAHSQPPLLCCHFLASRCTHVIQLVQGGLQDVEAHPAQNRDEQKSNDS